MKALAASGQETTTSKRLTGGNDIDRVVPRDPKGGDHT
jgi:hypothetical protein